MKGGLVGGGLGYGWLNWVVQVQSVTWVGVLISPSAPSVRGWVTIAFDSSAVEGDGGRRLCCHLCLIMAKSWFYSPFR